MANRELDNYLVNVYSDELIPEWMEEENWIDGLCRLDSFERAVGSIHARLANEGDDDYSRDQVRRALKGWLEFFVTTLVEDAPENVARGFEATVFRKELEKTRPAARAKPLPSGSIYTGMKVFNPAAFREMVLFFASKSAGVLKTKLNKLLWYADFLHFRMHGVSLSGATYVHLPFGPVPDQYESHLRLLSDGGSLTQVRKDYGEFAGECFSATAPPTAVHLPATALPILEAVHRRFSVLSSREISDLSHQEPGYVKTRVGQAISYEYARTMLATIPAIE